MIIEIQAPNLKVSEAVITAIKKKLLSISHLGEKISMAEVYLAEENKPADNKTCKITLLLTGDSLFVNKHADSFEKAASLAIRILKKRLKKIVENRNEPPEEIITTVDPEASVTEEGS